MLILLPPSEGKAPPARRGRPVELAALSAPELTKTRLAVRAAMVEASQHPGALRRAARSLRVQSALWGPVGPTDRIAPYRLSIAVSLPGLGPLAGVWRRVLAPVLSATAGSGVVVDCRSSTYATAWRPSGELARRTVAVRVFLETAGERTAVSHLAKHTRGLVARWVLEAARMPRTPAAVAEIVAGHRRCDLVDLVAAASRWT